MLRINHLEWVHYLPILTTAMSAAFFAILVKAARTRKSGPHLAWWAFGVFTYGLGTLLESLITLFGNTVLLDKAWYIAGAVLGGYPLAQGAVFLLCKRRTALMLTWITVPVIVAIATFVLLSPVDLTLMDSFRPSGKILEWHWVRYGTPFINLYAAAFLIGGAIWSALRFRKDPQTRYRAVGNTFIATGALLPGIGGAMAKSGLVEALYVGECIGLVLIWFGYSVIARHSKPKVSGSSVMTSPYAVIADRSESSKQPTIPTT